MKKIVLVLAMASAAISASASAALVSGSFSGTVTGGNSNYTGQSYSGSYAYDDAQTQFQNPILYGVQHLPTNSVTFNIGGASYLYIIDALMLQNNEFLISFADETRFGGAGGAGRLGFTGLNVTGFPVLPDFSDRQARFELFDSRVGSGFLLGSPVQVAAAIPEPATWAMMLVGFGAMGVAMRRRRTNTNAVQPA